VTPSLLLETGLAAIGLAITLLAVVLLGSRARQSPAAQALALIERSYAVSAPAAGAAGRGVFDTLPGWLRLLAWRLSSRSYPAALQRRLDLAGNPPGWPPDRILAVKGAGLAGLALLGGLAGLHAPALAVVYAVAGGAAGFFLPDLLLYNAGLKRQAKLQAALPDALDMLTVCVEAGLGFDAALAQVARNTRGPLAAEFARALQEMQIGKSRAQALRSMADRTTVAELRAFVSALVQAGELGIAVARVLREQAREMRLRRRQRAEEKAQKVAVKILFPLVGCLFPALFVVVIGPGAISIFHALFSR
jgi:tight adherence protein C